MARPLRLLASGFVVALAACGPASTTPQNGAQQSASAPPREQPSAHENAKREVARLTAIADKDPVLAPWKGPYGGVPPWDVVKPAQIPRAFEIGLSLMLAEVDVIAENPEPATFDNTMAPLEDAGRHYSRADVIFSVFTSNLNTKDVQAIDAEWAPKIAEAYDKITFNEKLFARVEAVYSSRQSAKLTPEQARLVERQYEQMVRQGAKLGAEDKKKLGAMNQALASLFTDFGNKVLADEDQWTVLSTEDEVDGLPDKVKSAFAAAAKEKGLDGKWIVANTRSAVDPFLTFSSKRDLREKVWKAFKNRGDNGAANDTNAVIAKIVSLRAERAKLLGYASHAHWRMADTMAKDPEKAKALMMRVWPAAVARVAEEVKDMQALAKKEAEASAPNKKPAGKGKGAPAQSVKAAPKTFEPWDYLYYAEKVRKAKYSVDQAELRNYFSLDNMIQGAFFMAHELYGLTFKEVTGKVPTFHADVRVWEVGDERTGQFVGLFYGDYFARAAKRSGAWASGYRGHETFTGTEIKPITSNNNNCVRGAADEPVLLSLDDAQTLFHEFGHALHGLLSRVRYPGLATTPRDFVEYPSQVHEMWVLTRPILDKFALHYKTKQPMPQSLVDKVEASSKFNQGYETVEYLSAAIVDMELHTLPAGTVIDPDAFERDTLARIGAPKEVAMRHRLPQFNHLFTSDSYSAGYYSYLWSEVMDADTREAFAETGNVFDRATADKMREFILSPGNSTDRAEAYRQFRGRDPDVNALLKKRGFPVGP
ncbi:MAG: M3 family metallopeptidase [Polyangiaceae bacterium]